MGERYISDPVVYNHFPNGFRGANHATRMQIYGSPVPYRPGIETVLGRLLSTYVNMWGIHPSQLLPRALTEELSLVRVGDRQFPQSGWSSDRRGSFQTAFVRESSDQGSSNQEESNQARNQSGPGQNFTSNQGTSSRDSDETSNEEEEAVITITDRQITLFGEIRDMFERSAVENEPRINLVLNCPICSERLRFTHPTNPERFVRITNGTEWLDVLPCGHMIGLVCMLEWTIECGLEGRRITCPICRFDLQYSDPTCNHPINSYPIEEGAPLPPLTVPEGGYLHTRCTICSGSEPVWNRAVWS